jgi:flagellin
MISIQTNYAAMVGEQNLATNNAFQTKTIAALTSGYRINNSGDDPAGLAVANQFRSNVAELTQGVINANYGVSTLQIIDGGLSNISSMLDRMKTLATESASSTFTGNRATVQAEFQTLQGEIDREADNIGLGANNTLNATNLQVYIGGGSSLANSQVAVNLSSAQVNSAALGVGGQINVNGALQGTAGVGNVNLNTGNLLLAGVSQAFAFTAVGPAGTSTVTATVAGGSAGITGSQVLASLNAQLNPYGVNASTDANGYLNFRSIYSPTAHPNFTVTAAAAVGGAGLAAAAATVSTSTGGTSTADALAAVTAINAAIQSLGSAQGAVGAGENDLNYAIGLANSQITNFSTAQAQIRDADIAKEAADLTKAQVMQQASVAQAVLKLLQ